jgi:hypothetical protein
MVWLSCVQANTKGGMCLDKRGIGIFGAGRVGYIFISEWPPRGENIGLRWGFIRANMSFGWSIIRRMTAGNLEGLMRKTAAIASALLASMTLAGPTLASNNYTIDAEHVTVSFTMQHSK